MAEHNGWTEYEKLVLWRLDQQDKRLERVEHKVDQVRTAVLALKIKAATYGTVAGFIAGAIIKWFTR